MKKKLITSALMTILVTAAIEHKVFAQKKESKSKKVANLPPPPPPPPPTRVGDAPPPPRAPKNVDVSTVQAESDKKIQATPAAPEPAPAPFANK